MRVPRIKESGEGFYHSMSRVVDRRMVLDDKEKERFKSILVEGSQGALSAIATYIDRNAVRAGIVSDPKDYRFCGYGEAIGRSRKAKEGLAMVMRSVGGGMTWSETCAEYRKLLYTSGQAQGSTPEGKPSKPGFSQAEVDRVLESGGQLSVHQALRCRVRYFSDGLILGSRTYVDDAFHRYRDRFGRKRKTGARSMKEVALGRSLHRKASTACARYRLITLEPASG